jgi:coproporphyrinogen III oxidase-like Fe-S oxidoreductase
MSPASVTNSSGNPSCNYYFFYLMSLGLLWHSIASSSSILSVNFLPPTFLKTAGVPSHVKSARRQGEMWNNHFRKRALIYATQLSFAESSDKLGLYVHIPYCRRRCHYCNFAIVPIGSTNTTYTDTHFNTYHTNTNFYKVNNMYEQAVLKELRLNEEWLSRNKVNYIQSVYFGGGTPSLAPITTLARIMDAIRQAFIVDPNAEITIEMDPGKF